MLNRFTAILVVATTLMGALPERKAEAGPLIDWLFGGFRPSGPAIPVGPAYAVGTVPTAVGTTPYVAGYAPAAGYSPVIGATYNAPVAAMNGYTTARPAVPVAPAMPTPVTMVPDYRSTFNRTPVTYYRPVMTTDPRTGAQVVTLAPCTSYEYQTQRVPTWGLTQVFNGGATLPATVAPVGPSAPLLTVPRGGVQLAGPLPSTQYSSAYGVYPASPSSIVPVTQSPMPAATATIGSGSVISPVTPGASYPSQTPYSTGYPNYSNSYGSYSALQPGSPVLGGTYPTNPMGSNSYLGAGAAGGGSCGNPVSPLPRSTITPANPGYSSVPGNPNVPAYSAVPGTAVPGPYPSGTNVAPAYPNSGFGGSSVPGTSVLPPNMPAAPGGSYPAPGSLPGGFNPSLPSQDPNANVPPVLPPPSGAPFQSGARLESTSPMRSAAREPMNATRDRSSQSVGNTASPSRDSNPTSNPSLMPIPLPADFKDEPRWNPGLLSEQDQTASLSTPSSNKLRTVSALKPELDGAFKPIQWVSYHSPSSEQASAHNNPVISANPVVSAGAEELTVSPELLPEPIIVRRNSNPYREPASKASSADSGELMLNGSSGESSAQRETGTISSVRSSMNLAPSMGVPAQTMPRATEPLPQGGASNVQAPALMPSSQGRISQPTAKKLGDQPVPPAARSRYDTSGWQKAN